MRRLEPVETATAVRKYREIPGLERHGFPRSHVQLAPAVDGEDQRRLIARGAHSEGFYEPLHPNGDAVRLGHHEVQVHAGTVQQLAVSSERAVEFQELTHLPQALACSVGEAQ